MYINRKMQKMIVKFCTQNYDKKAPAGFVRKESFDTSSVSNRQDDQYATNMFSEEFLLFSCNL